jgi:hypothetical protein
MPCYRFLLTSSRNFVIIFALSSLLIVNVVLKECGISVMENYYAETKELTGDTKSS